MHSIGRSVGRLWGIIWFQSHNSHKSHDHLRIIVFEKYVSGNFGGIALSRLNENAEL